MFDEGEQMFGVRYGRTNVLRTARRRGQFFSKGLFLCKSGAGTTAPAPMCRYLCLPIQQQQYVQQQYLFTTVCMCMYRCLCVTVYVYYYYVCVCTIHYCVYVCAVVYVCSTQRMRALSSYPACAPCVYEYVCVCAVCACSQDSRSHGVSLPHVCSVWCCVYLLCLLDVCIVVDVCCC